MIGATTHSTEHFRAKVDCYAPAKVNLFLEVLNRRADGFHEIETWMSAIRLFDRITISLPLLSNNDDQATTTLQDIKQDVSCRWDVGYQARLNDRAGSNFLAFGDTPTGLDNIAVRAVERLRQRAGIEEVPQIVIRKRIPSASGLGGASSDAALAIKAASKLYGLDWTDERLRQVAAEIGSDVPFFIGTSGSAICRGRGERIEPVRPHRPLHLVLVRPPVGISTPEAYRRVRVPENPQSVEKLQDGMASGNLNRISEGLFNRLEQSAHEMTPWMARLKSTFSRLGCLGHQMTGSGSVYFGICRQARHARSVAGALSGKRVVEVYQTTTLPTLTSQCSLSRQP